MKKIRLETENIFDWTTFHQQVKLQFCFPDKYTGTMADWIDRVARFADPGAQPDACGGIVLRHGELLTIEIPDSNDFLQRCGEQLAALVAGGEEVNRRLLQSGSRSAITFRFR